MNYITIETREDLYKILINIEKNNPNYNGRSWFDSFKLNLYKKFPNYLKRRLTKKVIDSRKGLFTIIKNDFPYSKLLKNKSIEHYIVWNTLNLPSEEEVLIDEVEKWLDQNFINRRWYLLHKNSPSLRSVKWIEHYHLFIAL